MIIAGVHAGEIEKSRFLAQAEAVAAFQHPNIVQVYEVGHHQNVPYMALELVTGGSLADRLKEVSVPAEKAANLFDSLPIVATHRFIHAISRILSPYVAK